MINDPTKNPKDTPTRRIICPICKSKEIYCDEFRCVCTNCGWEEYYPLQ